ncbi:MAG: hypothetical protein IK057_01035 [Clostridia bacterium]|nr:hypothetical protein [Clostridia bacterium]
MKYTWHGQILSLVIAHIEAAFIFFFVWLIAISITGTGLGGLIYSSVSAVFYSIMMYSVGYSVAKNDKKSYAKLTPFAYKGALISLGLLILNILTAILYRMSWTFGSSGGSLTNLWAVIGNVFTLFWFSPYMNLLSLDNGNMSVCGYLIIVFLHTVMCFLGYLAGYKNFDISAKLKFLFYEKK